MFLTLFNKIAPVFSRFSVAAIFVLSALALTLFGTIRGALYSVPYVLSINTTAFSVAIWSIGIIRLTERKDLSPLARQLCCLTGLIPPLLFLGSWQHPFIENNIELYAIYFGLIGIIAHLMPYFPGGKEPPEGWLLDKSYNRNLILLITIWISLILLHNFFCALIKVRALFIPGALLLSSLMLYVLMATTPQDDAEIDESSAGFPFWKYIIAPLYFFTAVIAGLYMINNYISPEEASSAFFSLLLKKYELKNLFSVLSTGLAGLLGVRLYFSAWRFFSSADEPLPLLWRLSPGLMLLPLLGLALSIKAGLASEVKSELLYYSILLFIWLAIWLSGSVLCVEQGPRITVFSLIFFLIIPITVPVSSQAVVNKANLRDLRHILTRNNLLHGNSITEPQYPENISEPDFIKLKKLAEYFSSYQARKYLEQNFTLAAYSGLAGSGNTGKVYGKNVFGLAFLDSEDYMGNQRILPVALPEGRNGLDKAVKFGLMRRGTESDLRAWQQIKAAQEGKPIAEIEGRYSFGGRLDLYSHNFYVINNSDLILPKGLSGANSALFILPAGLPKPKGALESSVILYMENGHCEGFRCR